MNQSKRFRYRISFSKTSTIRFISHLDLHHAWERTLRRARIPLVYTQGFNPRVRLNLSPALPLGCTSDCELADIWLSKEYSPASILEDLRRVAPIGIEIHAVKRVDNRQPSLQKQVVAVEYEVNLDSSSPIENLRSSVQSLMKAKTIPRTRRGKDYDLRPLLEALDIECVEGAKSQIKMRLAAREGATGRPEEVLLELGLDPTTARSCRTRLFLAND